MVRIHPAPQNMLLSGQTDNESIKKTSHTLERLVEATIQFNKKTSKQTGVIIGLTVIMVIGLVVQILMGIHADTSCTVSTTGTPNLQAYNCITYYDLGLFGGYTHTRQFEKMQ